MKSSALVDRKFSECALCQMAMMTIIETGMSNKAMHPDLPRTVIMPIKSPIIAPAIIVASVVIDVSLQ
jgi:hypothetical protein